VPTRSNTQPGDCLNLTPSQGNLAVDGAFSWVSHSILSLTNQGPRQVVVFARHVARTSHSHAKCRR
jgi:hypothetical protein